MHITPMFLQICALAALAPFPHFAVAHTWEDFINVIGSNGTLLEPPGYARQHRNNGFQKLIGEKSVLDTANMCVDFQASPLGPDGQPNQAKDLPRLQASPGDMIAFRYKENGHVSLLQPEGRVEYGGPVWAYGTTNGKTNPKLLDVVGKWNPEGTGGDKSGRLLANEYYDDGRCYEDNGSPPSNARKAKAPITDADISAYKGLPCQTTFRLPDDAPVGKPYTVFWVWDFSRPKVQGGTEWYTVCLDIDVVAPKGPSNKAVAKYASDQRAAVAAVPDYFKNMVGKAPPLMGAPHPPKVLAGDAGLPKLFSYLPAPPAGSSAPAAAGQAPAQGNPVPSGQAAAPPAQAPAVKPTPADAPPTQAPAAGKPQPSGRPSVSVPSQLLNVKPVASAPGNPGSKGDVTVTVTQSAAAEKVVTVTASAQPTTAFVTITAEAGQSPSPLPPMAPSQSQVTGAPAAPVNAPADGAYNRRDPLWRSRRPFSA